MMSNRRMVWHVPDADRVIGFPRLIARLLIRAYQLILSPVIGNQCRFHPSCSQYALDAIDTHGVLRGGWLAARRLGHCHPFHPGGFDPVPGCGGGASCTDRPSAVHPSADGRLQTAAETEER